MRQHSGISKPALQPDDVSMLQAILRGWCQEKSYAITSPAAELVARELVSWFECGIRDKHKLTGLMRHMHLDLEEEPGKARPPATFKASQWVFHNG
ncbi:hypothetical protein PYR71_23045 [Rhizobium sp. MC63]|uniref:Uncharacterized protein n=1 Tax=Rhizobium mulingense TaxID=3031128 RepID=A0ACC6N2I0_9HYPH|nr:MULTISPECIES: hypothetical protein [unclassified Rhizobium]MDF0699327.1 hypothetical protein [Rhizobium sp. MC63]MEA3519645.1 hypothetical protein [Rhizobium sp. MJ31]MEB3045991.1 hypothetical protein [Rhizobium sp. MJ21]